MNRLPPPQRLSEPPVLPAADPALILTDVSRLHLSDARTAAEPVVAEYDEAHVVSVTPLLATVFDGSTIHVSVSEPCSWNNGRT